MTQKQTNRHSHNGATSAPATANPERLRAVPASDPEVVPKAQRRIFTASYKLWVLEEADKCREQPGRLGALRRREGLYSSHLSKWRQQRAAGQLAGLEPQKRGRKTDEAAAEISQLRQDKARLEQQLAQAELIIEAQKKLSELLGLMVAPAQAGVSSGRPS